MTDNTLIVDIPGVGERTFRLPRRMYEAARLGLYSLTRKDAGPEWSFIRGALIVAMLWADDDHPLPVLMPKTNAPTGEWVDAGCAVVDHLVEEDGWPEPLIGRVGGRLMVESNKALGLGEEDVEAKLDFGVRRPGDPTSSE